MHFSYTKKKTTFHDRQQILAGLQHLTVFAKKNLDLILANKLFLTVFYYSNAIVINSDCFTSFQNTP